MRWHRQHEQHDCGRGASRFMRGGSHEERHFGGHHGFGRNMRGMGRGDGRGRERVFDQGDLRLVILNLVMDKPRHGYDMIKAIEERLDGAYSPSPGVVYPTLTM